MTYPVNRKILSIHNPLKTRKAGVQNKTFVYNLCFFFPVSRDFPDTFTRCSENQAMITDRSVVGNPVGRKGKRTGGVTSGHRCPLHGRTGGRGGRAWFPLVPCVRMQPIAMLCEKEEKYEKLQNPPRLSYGNPEELRVHLDVL
jgi:hypothetical protein